MTCSFWDLEGPEKPSILSWMDENQPPQDASPCNEEYQKQIEILTKQLDQTNKMYKKCLLENANNAELLKTKDQLLEGVDKSQKLEREILNKKYDMINKKYDMLNKVNENQERNIKKLQEQNMVQEKAIKASDIELKGKQDLIDKLEESDIISKELINNLEKSKNKN